MAFGAGEGKAMFPSASVYVDITLHDFQRISSCSILCVQVRVYDVFCSQYSCSLEYVNVGRVCGRVFGVGFVFHDLAEPIM